MVKEEYEDRETPYIYLSFWKTGKKEYRTNIR